MPAIPSSFVIQSPLPVASGGTGSATQNFVDLTSTQSVGGVKTYTSKLAMAVGVALTVTTGSNAKAGTATLAAGTVAVATTAATANSLVFVTDTSASGTNVGSLYVASVTAGTGFTVKSTNVSDTSTFNWLIVEGA